MATNPIGYNQEFPIYNADGTPFNNLVLKKSTVESVVMSLGDKISGNVYYIDNTLAVTMREYVVVDGVKYTLVNPPTVVREGCVSNDSSLNGATKYSFTFYHPMYMLGNFPFTDIAVTQDEQKYLSQNKTFSWIGSLFDMIAKLNANLQGTEWIVVANIPRYEQDGVTATSQWQKASELSDVLSFDKNFISDALKTSYDTWDIPFIISPIKEGEEHYSEGKRFLVSFGLPTQEIYDDDGVTPFVFKFGQGVGLKNNSRTPRNNKIITRLSGYGSERNVPYGYPQIIWTGDQTWDYTINNAEGMQPIEIGGQTIMAMSYPIYDGIVGGQKVRLIKHPFTRTTLMPPVYVDSVNKKVNPNATGYNPNTAIIDYYDSVDVNPLAPSYETHQFEEVYPRLGDAELTGVYPYDDTEYVSIDVFRTFINVAVHTCPNQKEKDILSQCLNYVYTGVHGTYTDFLYDENGGSYTCKVVGKYHAYLNSYWYAVKYTSDHINFEYNVYMGNVSPATLVVWDDSMNDDGEYVQSYFKVRLPQLSFDIYACAAITEEMQINMRSGACIGCTFPVEVDWDDYKRNFYKQDGTFDPVIHTQDGDGHVRDGNKYPDSSAGQITVVVKKDIDTFGTLMPNTYQKPASGDKFTILGISLPTSYVTAAENELEGDINEYLIENGVHYYDYPLTVDEYFLATHTYILQQIRNNNIFRFEYAGVQNALYIKQIVVKYGEKPLPQYDITLTDDVEIVLNPIGQVTDDVSRMRVQLNELQKYYGENVIAELSNKLSKIADDVAQGLITFQQGLDSIGRVILYDEIKSANYENGLYTGRGWRVDELGNAEFESIRARSFIEAVEMIINRQQAQEGDTVFADNDQIDKVEKVIDPSDGTTTYILSLKEKWSGYITGQMYGNIVKGIINTMAAKQAGVSQYTDSSAGVIHDGENTYFVSWMRVINTNSTKAGLGVNQIEVVLYGDNEVPAGKNFEPCELMVIARRGCVDYSNPEDPNYETVKASIIRRQRTFEISVSDGRVTKYTGVDSPILRNYNYGVTIGELPDFVKQYAKVREVLSVVGEHTDWLYAQGVVVGNYVKVDVEGIPVPEVVDCGDWIDGNRTEPLTIQIWDKQRGQYVDHVLTFPIPSTEFNKSDSLYIGHGIYFNNKYNALTQRYETHKVRHSNGTWLCLQDEPVIIGGQVRYNAPHWNSAYWRLTDGNGNYSIEFDSSRGYSFRVGSVNTHITPQLFYGNVQLTTDDVPAVYWCWKRCSEANWHDGHPVYTEQDRAWNSRHEGVVDFQLTNADMPSDWSSINKAVFSCIVTINDGSGTTVNNQIIS